MNAVMNFKGRLPAEAVGALVDQHGPWRVLGALMTAVLRRPRQVRVLEVVDLSDHLRRDIGLPPGDGGFADRKVRPTWE